MKPSYSLAQLAKIRLFNVNISIPFLNQYKFSDILHQYRDILPPPEQVLAKPDVLLDDVNWRVQVDDQVWPEELADGLVPDGVVVPGEGVQSPVPGLQIPSLLPSISAFRPGAID